MAITPVTAGTIIDPVWGNAVADALNTTTITTGAVAASGWSLTSFTANYTTTVAWFVVTVERTGGTITVGADGDIGNVNVATLPAAVRGSGSFWQALTSAQTGRLAAGVFKPTSGDVDLCAIAPGVDINNTEIISLGGCVSLVT